MRNPCTARLSRPAAKAARCGRVGLLSDSMSLAPLSGCSLFVFVSGLCLGACSDQASTSAKGAGGSAGGNPSAVDGVNTGGQVRSSSDAGSSSAEPRNSELPEPPDDTCERFHLTEASCRASQCPPWPCDPNTTHNFLGTNWCNSRGASEHCLGGFDCSAAEADVAGAELVACLSLYRPCVVNADCSDDAPYCVVDARYATGTCGFGTPDARCRADDDCRPGSLCVASDADGTRGCSDGGEDSPCNIDAECKGKRCIHEPGISVDGLNSDPEPALAGVCSSGEPGSICFTDEATCPPGTSCSTGVNDGKCVGDARCIRVPTSSTRTKAGTLCSSGKVGDPCAQNSDCKSAHCPFYIDRVCTEGAIGERCSDPKDCESGFCAPPPKGQLEGVSNCSTGEVGEPCLSAADCKSNRCDPAPADSPFLSVCSK